MNFGKGQTVIRIQNTNPQYQTITDYKSDFSKIIASAYDVEPNYFGLETPIILPVTNSVEV